MTDSKAFREACWMAFREGATRPSLGAVVIVISLNVLAFLLICVYVNAEFMVGPYSRYAMEGYGDTFARATSRALGFRSPAEPAVAILGTSVTIGCIVDEQRLADMIMQHSGETPEVYDLAANGETTWEMAALVDQLRPRFDGVLVIGFSPGMLEHGISDSPWFGSLVEVIEQPRLGFVSATLDMEAGSEGVKVPFRTGIYAVDNRYFLLARLGLTVRNLLGGAASNRDPVDPLWIGRPVNPEYSQEEIARLPREIGYYDANRDVNLDLIARFANELRSRGQVSVIALESPVHPGWHLDEVGRAFYGRYRRDIAQFAAENGMEFVSITDEAELELSDFADYEGHLGNVPARERCTQVLVHHLTEYLGAGHGQSN